MVQFYPWFKFSFLLFLGMVMYDNNMIMSLKQKKRKFEPRIKLNHNIYMDLAVRSGSNPTTIRGSHKLRWIQAAIILTHNIR